jgi:hypothetical protein
MHDALFAAACRPDPAACLCLPLRPYSIGHEAELWRQGNPLLCLTYAGFDALPEDQQRAALASAVDACSQTWVEYAESAAILASAPRWHQFDQRRRKNRLRSIWRRWQAALAKFEPVDWAMALADFRNHLAVGRACFQALSSDDPDDVLALSISGDGTKLEGGRCMGSPTLAHLVAFAIEADLPKMLGLATVFDVPFSLCANLHLTRLESQGNVYIRNEREQRIRDEQAQHREAMKAEEAEARKVWEAIPEDDEDAKREAVAKFPAILIAVPDSAKYYQPPGQNVPCGTQIQQC